jgi:hypothetical protein
MTEWKLFDGDVPHVSTPEFHANRERAPHLEQPHHQPRLQAAAEMILHCHGATTFCDLGCGDGGLLSLVQDGFEKAWGYDFQPSNAAGWHERGVDAAYLDVFGQDRDKVLLGGVVACTEVLEHLADPHGVLKWLYDAEFGPYEVVCSSPVNENDRMHDECHAWAWDYAGYEALVEGAGFKVAKHVVVGNFQLIRGYRQ